MYLRVAGACLNQTPLAFSENLAHIRAAIADARDQGVALLCLPELCIPGYGCEDMFYSEYVLQASQESLMALLPDTHGIAVTVGLPMLQGGCLYNCAAMLHNGRILGFVAKQHLAGDGIYYEPRWFKRWQDGVQVQVIDGVPYPFGDLVFDIAGVRVGFEICEDAWNGARPANDLYFSNVDIILNPSASNFAFGKSQVRERLVTESSRTFACTYVYSNLLGNEAGRIIFDGEVLVASGGTLLARNERFSFRDWQVQPAVADLRINRLARRKAYNYDFREHPGVVTDDLPLAFCLSAENAPVSMEVQRKEEEFSLAETLGLWDYMRKSRSKGFVLSLSGGADSSCCAVLCATMFQRALTELGPEQLAAKLSYTGISAETIEAIGAKGLINKLLTCVYQATQNSGDATLTSARELAEGLGATFHQWDVEPLHQTYKALAASTLGRELSWEKDDIALQNIQARLRAPGIWMVANLSGGLLLTTSNRSEAAVGYATMDGDTSGGLAPLGGIDKAFIITWLKWAQTALSVPELSYVNSLQPTAELRPAERYQTDEQDLMPYDLLEAIEEKAIGEYLPPVEVFTALRGWNGLDDGRLKAYIRRFFTLWSRNQWKRERYAPCFHLDDKNLDPKTWCRFPILSGGFADALKALEA